MRPPTIRRRSNFEQSAAQKDPDANIKMAAYYNNLAEVYGKSNQMDDAVKSYQQAATLDPPHAGQYLFNTGAVLTNAGKVDDAIVAFDKVIAADPTKADAYYWKGVNLVGKATTDKSGKVIAAPGTEEAFTKYLELATLRRPCRRGESNAAVHRQHHRNRFRYQEETRQEVARNRIRNTSPGSGLRAAFPFPFSYLGLWSYCPCAPAPIGLH